MSSARRSSEIPQPLELSESQRFLIDEYVRIGRPSDHLLYTPEFEEVVARYREKFGPPDISEREVFFELLLLRKSGRLPRLGRWSTGSGDTGDEDYSLLESLVAQYAGTLGQRDRLPYTDEFVNLVREFNERTGNRGLSELEVWRMICRLAK
ncbi:MAG: hypothetical protein SF069_01440 [Phycisphaerae bacterium]|nr:hypothetical protein [Phycisphaerae bacterium]